MRYDYIGAIMGLNWVTGYQGRVQLYDDTDKRLLGTSTNVIEWQDISFFYDGWYTVANHFERCVDNDTHSNMERMNHDGLRCFVTLPSNIIGDSDDHSKPLNALIRQNNASYFKE